MIVTSDMLKSFYKNYSNIENKISREVKNGNLFKIKNGLYETNPNTPAYLLAGCIYGPSYISFDYALSLYGLIPERAINCTCATFGKKKSKKYDNYFGTFLFRDIPKRVYPYGICLILENEYSYQIATKEKAICDKLYILKPLKNLKELEYMLFEDLRIDYEEFYKLDKKVIEELASLYHSTNVTLLLKYLRRNVNE